METREVWVRLRPGPARTVVVPLLESTGIHVCAAYLVLCITPIYGCSHSCVPLCHSVHQVNKRGLLCVCAGRTGEQVLRSRWLTVICQPTQSGPAAKILAETRCPSRSTQVYDTASWASWASGWCAPIVWYCSVWRTREEILLAMGVSISNPVSGDNVNQVQE